MIEFHKYDDGPRTAFEEHLVEGAGYALMDNGHVNIHLTVSPEHKKLFENLLDKVRSKYENLLKVKFEISFSVQKPSTDTISLDHIDEPFREKNGKLHFRPGGHGALLENLNDMDADIIFIKNIDNVQPDRLKQETILYKKALAGVLLEFQEKSFDFLSLTDNDKDLSDKKIDEIRVFLEGMGINLDLNGITDKHDKIKLLKQKLNRPIRVCGMVKNVGEPGGGPFWVKQSGRIRSLQIVESSQVNHKDPEQEAMLHSSTHFNPVDLVCGIRNYKGEKFDLLTFRDPNTCFISKKYKNGKPLKAFELPGLWNGSMADWNTIFVEVPISTFSPVKTLHDLLRPVHQ